MDEYLQEFHQGLIGIKSKIEQSDSKNLDG
jgi:hypothetical protein